MIRPPLSAFKPNQPMIGMSEIVRLGIGAFIGIGLTGLITTYFFGVSWQTPLVVAPMGAASVLMFTLPESPRVQPWPMFFGSLVAGLVGVSCAKLIPQPLMAVAVAVALTMVAQALCRCTHPPGGAVAVLVTLGGAGVLGAGYHFVFIPIMLNVVILMVLGFLYNNLTGRPYPHFEIVRPMPFRLSRETYAAILREQHRDLDITPDDLEALHVAVQRRSVT